MTTTLPLDSVWVVTSRDMGDTETSVAVFATREGAMASVYEGDASYAEFCGTSEADLWTDYSEDAATGEAMWSNDDTVRFLRNLPFGA